MNLNLGVDKWTQVYFHFVFSPTVEKRRRREEKKKRGKEEEKEKRRWEGEEKMRRRREERRTDEQKWGREEAGKILNCAHAIVTTVNRREEERREEREEKRGGERRERTEERIDLQPSPSIPMVILFFLQILLCTTRFQTTTSKQNPISLYKKRMQNTSGGVSVRGARVCKLLRGMQHSPYPDISNMDPSGVK
jgi:hypothetical protein